MKQSKYLLLTLLLMVLGSNCDNQRKVPQQKNTADTIITVKKGLLSQYDKQIRAYYLDLTKVSDGGVLSFPQKAQVEYTDIAVELIDEAIRRKDYKSVDSERVREAILKCFGADVNQSSDIQLTRDFRTYIFKSGSVTERTKQEKSMGDGGFGEQEYFWNRLVYVLNYNYIITSPTIDSAVEIEGLPDDTIGKNHRKVIKRGKSYLNSNDSMFFNGDNFILYDSRDALEWLRKNGAALLIDLLCEYRHDKNEEINKLVMTNMLREYTDVNAPWILDSTLASRGKAKHAKVEIREGLLKSILELPATEENMEWIRLFNDYIDYLLNIEKQKLPMWVTKFTKEECYKVATCPCCYLYKFNKKYNRGDTSLLGHELYYNSSFCNYIDSQHYFSLPGFEALCGKVYEEYDVAVKDEAN